MNLVKLHSFGLDHRQASALWAIVVSFELTIARTEEDLLFYEIE
jgi:hypothetical protein